MLTCEVDSDLAEIVSVMLFEGGALAVGEEPTGDRVLLRAGFESEADARTAAEMIADWGTATVTMVAPTWQDEQRDGFVPTTVGPWHLTMPDIESAPPDRVHLRIDPGRAFGHGAHPSTRLLLELLAIADPASGVVLDVGTGTGVLAIAAASLGATVTAVDIDPIAVECAQANVDRNDVADLVEVALLDGGSAEPFAPCALAMVNVTIDQHRRIAPQLDGAARILVSGLLEHQLAEAAHVYRRRIVNSATAEGWVAALLEGDPLGR
jgi:ribosomal protein L11 methyltransferase